MSQHDYVIDNQSAPNFRTDLNNALAAIATTNGGVSEPSTTYANQLWVDTTNNQLKIRNEDNDAWIIVGTLDQSANTFQASYSLGFTPVQQGGGAFQGTNKVYIGWDGGGLRAQVDVTDLGRLAFFDSVAFDALAGASVGQGTAVQNTRGKTSFFTLNCGPNNVTSRSVFSVQHSSDGVNWADVSYFDTVANDDWNSVTIMIPNTWFWRVIRTSGSNTALAVGYVEWY